MDPYGDQKNETQTKSKYPAREISGFISFIIFFIAAGFLKYLNYSTESIISISIAIATSSSGITFYILARPNISKYLNGEFKIKRKYFFVFISLIAVIFIYNSYRLSGAEEGKIKCIFPDGTRKCIPLSETIYETKYDSKLLHNEELISVFPQLNDTPFVTQKTYSSNGNSTSKFHEDKSRSNHYEITFKNMCPSSDCNSGWMIFPLMGFDAQKYSNLSFEVKGKRGGEKFGVGLKDTNGDESKINSTELDIEVTTNWQEVEIPLERFNYIFDPDRSSLDVISIFTDGSLYSERDNETIFVRGFKFE